MSKNVKTLGSFPKYLQTPSTRYLSSLYDSIIFRDVMARNGLTNEKEMQELIFYHADKKECDFVVREGMRIQAAYLVTIAMNDKKTRKREINGLLEALEAYDLPEGFILTMEDKEEVEIDGKQIHVLPTWEWMCR